MSVFIKFLTITFFVIIFTFVQTGLSQEFSYSGKVINFKGEPIPGATVKLKKAGKSTITADDGSFTLSSKSTSINGIPYRLGRPDFTALRDGYLEIRLLENAPVSITAFSVGGKTLYHKKTLLNAGIHSVSIPVTGQGVCLLSVKYRGQEVIFKTCSFKTDILGNALSVKDYSSRVLPKQAANLVFDDKLFVTKTEYLDYQTRMYNKPEASGMVIRMASVDHPVWSRELLYKIGSAPFRSCHASSIVELPDGTLLSVYFGGSRESAKDVEVRLSRKEPGKPWEAPISIADSPGSVENPVIFQGRDGKIFVFWKITHVTNYRMGRMKISTDGGKTWGPERKLGEKIMGPEKNKPVQLEDGTILTPNADRNGWVEGGKIFAERSADGGETWENLRPADNGNVRDAIQPTMFVHTDGRLQMMARSTGKIPMTFSDDNGETWSPLEHSILPANGSGIDGVTLRDGRLFLTYNHVPSKGKGPRNFLNAAVSKDGKAWSAALVLGICGGGQFSYPAVIQGRDGLVHVVHTWHRATIAHIVVNPYKITDATTVPMPNGEWPASGPLSKGENKDKEG